MQISAAPARAFLSSYLAFQRTLSAERFARNFPHPWLVWEPGTWSVPTRVGEATLMPSSPREPARGDALLFELSLAPGASLVAGRSPEHPVVINDATFSRNQLVFLRTSADAYAVALVPHA